MNCQGCGKAARQLQEVRFQAQLLQLCPYCVSRVYFLDSKMSFEAPRRSDAPREARTRFFATGHSALFYTIKVDNSRSGERK